MEDIRGPRHSTSCFSPLMLCISECRVASLIVEVLRVLIGGCFNDKFSEWVLEHCFELLHIVTYGSVFIVLDVYFHCIKFGYLELLAFKLFK